MLRVECTKCDRKGRYSVAKLIAKHGRKGNMPAWVSDLKGDCPNATLPGSKTVATWCVRTCRRYCEMYRSRATKKWSVAEGSQGNSVLRGTVASVVTSGAVMKKLFMAKY